jgi:hypothetical protein
MSKMGLHDTFGHLQHKLWPNKRSGVKLAVDSLIPNHGKESTQFLCVQVACDMPLKKFRQGLQLWFRPHCDRRSSQEVIAPQSCETPNLGDFRTPIWESLDKKPFTCHSRREMQNILYGGRWWLPLSLGRGESCESEVTRGSS